MHLKQIPHTPLTPLNNPVLSCSDLWQNLLIPKHLQPLNEDHLDVIRNICQDALSQSPRLVCFDFYLNLPPGITDETDNNLTAFLNMLIQQFHSDLQKREDYGGRPVPCRIRYLWMRMPEGSGWSYRVLLLLSSDAYFRLGKKYQPQSYMLDRVQYAWMEVTECDGWQIAYLVNFSKECDWYFNCYVEGTHCNFGKLFYRASSFASAGKSQLGWSRN